MKTILVTGGAGYIGSHSVIELMTRGYDVIIIDNFINSDPIALNNLYKICLNETGRRPNFFSRDCREDLDDILSTHKVDCVIHFAALKSVGDSVENPIQYYDNNINSLLNMLDICRKYEIPNFVFSSSCSLYGDVDELPVSEKTKLSDPQSPYAYTKLIGERIIKDFCKVSGINAVSLRYFNPVGAHKSGYIGESPINKPNNIIPVICESINGDEMFVFGDDYETRDGSCIRDYIHVSDIATAHVLAFEWLKDNTDKGTYDIFNLGSDSGVSVFELIDAFEKVNDVKVRYRIGNRRSGDVVKIYSDSTKAREILGWKPENNIEDMVSSAWIWFKSKK